MRPFFPPPELCHWGFRDKALFVFPPFKTFLPWALLKEIEPVFQFKKKKNTLYWIDMCSSNKTIYWTLFQRYSITLQYSALPLLASLFSWLHLRRDQTLTVSNSPFQLQQMLIILRLTSVCVCVFPFTESLHMSSAAGWRGGKKTWLELLCLLGNVVSLSD